MIARDYTVTLIIASSECAKKLIKKISVIFQLSFSTNFACAQMYDFPKYGHLLPFRPLPVLISCLQSFPSNKIVNLSSWTNEAVLYTSAHKGVESGGCWEGKR